jgi:hypothetical protein
MESYTSYVKLRSYGRINEILELDYSREKVLMFRVRWAKSVVKEDRGFTTMCKPEAKSKSAGANFTTKYEPWVLAKNVDQCFFITDPSRPSSEWMVSPMRKTLTSIATQHGKMTITTKQPTPQEEAGQPYPSEVFHSKEEFMMWGSIIQRRKKARRLSNAVYGLYDVVCMFCCMMMLSVLMYHIYYYYCHQTPRKH